MNRDGQRRAIMAAIKDGRILPGSVAGWAVRAHNGADIETELAGLAVVPSYRPRREVLAHTWVDVRKYLDSVLPPDPKLPDSALPEDTEEESPESDDTSDRPKAAAWSGDPEFEGLWPPASRREAQRRHADNIAAAAVSSASDDELYSLLFRGE
jgi:hypothetical protein